MTTPEPPPAVPTQAFFRGPTGTMRDPLERGDRLEVRVYDRDNHIIGSFDLLGDVTLTEPVQVSPKIAGMAVDLSLFARTFRMWHAVPPPPPSPQEVRAAVDVLRRAGWRATTRQERGVLSDLMPDLLAIRGGPGTAEHTKQTVQTPWTPIPDTETP